MIQAVEQAAEMPLATYSQGKVSAREGQRERAKSKKNTGRGYKMLETNKGGIKIRKRKQEVKNKV